MNKPFVVRSTQKRLFRSSGVLNQTPKNTSYVLGFDRMFWVLVVRLVLIGSNYVL